jgi:hypothetical protein
MSSSQVSPQEGHLPEGQVAISLTKDSWTKLFLHLLGEEELPDQIRFIAYVALAQTDLVEEILEERLGISIPRQK